MRLVLGSVGVFVSRFLSTASATLVTNGDFETPDFNGYYAGGETFGGWKVGGNGVEHVDLWQAASGSRVVDLSGNTSGAISQVISTTAGTDYLLRFALAGNPDGTPGQDANVVKGMVLEWSESGETVLREDLLFDTAGRTAEDMGWIYHDFVVTAASSSATLVFSSQESNPYGPLVDDVSVVEIPGPIPEPTALIVWSLLGTVAITAGWWRRRKHTFALSVHT